MWNSTHVTNKTDWIKLYFDTIEQYESLLLLDIIPLGEFFKSTMVIPTYWERTWCVCVGFINIWSQMFIMFIWNVSHCKLQPLAESS